MFKIMERILILQLLLLFCNINLFAAADYNGYKVYEVTPLTQTQNDLLVKLSRNVSLYDLTYLDYSENRIARLMVHPTAQKDFINLLQQSNLNYKIITENVAESLKVHFEQNQRLLEQYPYKRNGRLSTERYYTHEEINNYIEDLAKLYPKRVFVKTFGKSYEGRLLKTITITNGDRRANKNVIFVDGGFHAREWISPASVLYAIEQLVEKYEQNADLLLDYDWVILPVVNADGYAFTHEAAENRLWRKTRTPNGNLTGICVGTDPNRNFDFHWMETGASNDSCSNAFAGPYAFSEPEVRVVRDIIHSLNGRGKMYLTVHACGRLILYPWGYAKELPDTWLDLNEVADAGAKGIYDASGADYTIGCSAVALYEAAGAADDYAFKSGFPIAFTYELACAGPNGHDPPAYEIDALVKEAWAGTRAMALKVIEKYPLNKK